MGQNADDIAKRINDLYEEGKVEEAQELEQSVVVQTIKPNTDEGNKMIDDATGKGLVDDS